ncbi:CRISPR-associated protein Csh1 [Arenibacter nanhaiticus]|uniref:CRISPR-associated protein Csh1 n=1 Tax=Arenibacter nanhaiticus TaxID=558155 RepID=A0A1M6JY16_9FLAO|nr:TM1802 family CRISPR-associated protein [Arenibacter nanhaiticus]SHJ51518.1 CRISPR-associated protein Csh1 [Arenibacter nanhaiticus]
MLNTLLKIGEWQSQGKSEWDRFLDYPKVEREDKRGNPIKNYTLPIIFDLDAMEVIISQENLREYDEEDVKEALGIKMKGSNSKAVCSAGLAKRLGRIYQSFFGKEESDAENGELIEAIEKENSAYLTENLQDILSRIFNLKDQFLKLTLDSKKTIDIRAINEKFEINSNENIVFLATYLKSLDCGYEEPVLIANLPDYNAFLEYSILGIKEDKDSQKTKSKLCYASGAIVEDVEEINLSSRYSLNKMFVTETKNYASNFYGRNFSTNYQVGIENQKLLDYASDFLLQKGFTIQIANINHVIIPQFQYDSTIDLPKSLKRIQQNSDMLFGLNDLSAFSTRIEDRIFDETFWLNFVAYDSNGTFFKSTEIIKDVSSFHFNKVLKIFSDVDWIFREARFLEWNSVMTERDNNTKELVRRNFNFNSIYKIIPLRKDKEKKNKALDLFKTILENRKVSLDFLYKCFNELILCNYYERYRSYSNVHPYSKDYFSNAVRNNVFKYHAFIQFLKKINLIDMPEIINNSTEDKASDKYDQAIQDFFNTMDMANHRDQQAMFYLGRMLNAVEYIQLKKQIKKTVIHLVNFNGLDLNSIKRLRNDLINKARQHNQIGKVKFLNGQFGEKFNLNSWNMDPNEALFFLLTGYSFRVSIQESEEQENLETNEEIN